MRISLSQRNIGEISGKAYLLRFFYGGAVTVATGLVAQHFGPQIGGYFLAFPAIFPASATLIVRQMRERKEAVDPRWRRWAGKVVSLEARGTIDGSIGMIAFAAFMWWTLLRYESWAIFSGALCMWLLTALVVRFIAMRFRQWWARRGKC